MARIALFKPKCFCVKRRDFVDTFQNVLSLITAIPMLFINIFYLFPTQSRSRHISLTTSEFDSSFISCQPLWILNCTKIKRNFIMNHLGISGKATVMIAKIPMDHIIFLVITTVLTFWNGTWLSIWHCFSFFKSLRPNVLPVIIIFHRHGISAKCANYRIFIDNKLWSYNIS